MLSTASPHPLESCQETPAQRAYSGTRLGAAVQELADGQYGVVTRSQLVALGMSGSAVSRWTRNGRLQRIHRCVYAVGHRRIRREGWRMAGLLASGPGSVLAHWSALAVPGLATDRSTVHVIPADRGGATVRGVRVHRSSLDPSEVGWCEGFPVTTVERSILDVSPDASDRQIGQLLDDALRRQLYDHRRMMLAIDRAHGRHGLGRLIAAVAKMDGNGELFRSTTERVVRDRLVRAGIRRPLVNVPIAKGNGEHYELDLLWPKIGLNVEIDGPQHELPHQMAADAARDAWLRDRGFCVVRVPVARVDHEFAVVTEEIRALVETCVAGRPLSGRPVTELGGGRGGRGGRGRRGG